MPTIPGFFGREAELTWLLRLWDDTAIRDTKGVHVGPRLAIVIAETGLGKSRLVQALYQRLTNDPLWNPFDRSYWPSNIVSETGQIRVNPVLDDYVPSGPPRFLWLGGRWQETEARNVEERRCIIPALRDMLAVHVRIAQRHRTVWQRLRTSAEKKIKDEGPDYVLDKALDLSGIPYAGLVLKLIRAGASARNAPTTVGEAIHKQQEDASEILLEEMREVFGGLGGGGLVLPTVLWLDDAHWIDPLTLRFLHKLWKEAKEKLWPLLIVLTHWEQEWNKLGLEATGESLLALAMQPGSEKLILTKAPVADIEARLNQKLPGLLPAQRASMLEKSAGNFLTLEENVGELISDPENFVDQRVDGALAPAGEDLVATWASERQTRIHDRFLSMKPKPTLQQLLAWASRVGIQFPQVVPADFAVRRQGGSPLDRHQLLKSCMEPYAVLGTPSPNFLEFRDRAYYAEGAEYFRRHLAQKDETELLVTLRATLADWINGAFDENGKVHPTDDQKTSVSGENTDQFTSFTKDERRAVLEIALRELPLPPSPDWTNVHHQAAFRAVLLYLDRAGQDSLWPAVSQCAPRLRGVHWQDIPPAVASTEFLLGIGFSLSMAAMTDVAAPLFEQMLARMELDTQKNSDWANWMIATLGALAMIHISRGSFDAGEQLTLRSLHLTEQTFGPDNVKVAAILFAQGKMLIIAGRYQEAEASLLRAKAIFEQFLREQKLPPNDLTLLKLEGVLGEVCLRTSRAAEAEAHFRLLMGIESRLDPESLAMALENLGDALSAQGHSEQAESLHRRALSIMESTFGPGHPNFGVALNSLAIDLKDQGRIKEAIELMTRCCDIAEQVGAPAQNKVAALINLAEMHRSQGDEIRAAPFARRALAIAEEMFGPDHPIVATILGNEAETLRVHGMFKAAEPLFIRAIAIMERSPDARGLPLAATCNSLGLLLQADGRLAEAEVSFERAMTFMEPDLSPDFGPDYAKVTHQPLGPGYNSLGLIFQTRGQLAEAGYCFERAGMFMEHDLGPGHPEVSQLFENSSLLYRAMGDNDKAEAALKRAQEIRQAVKDRSKAPLSAPVAE